ncbi:ankyrin repeat domain-containing protein [Fontivita pretiosa]|uniref:ankyrin repeat domain-containing protein n=1 Tax=Fontivita pretiosa TaxID=2989684 RepID=UPI003D185110
MRSLLLRIGKLVILLTLFCGLCWGPIIVRRYPAGGADADERLLLALRFREWQQIDEALASGASPNAIEPFSQQTALMIAASNGDLHTTRELLSRGADLHAVDRCGRTALAHAACAGKTDVARLLLDRGASVNQPDSLGMTPLAHAALYAHVSTVALLLSRGADPNAACDDGTTPLMLAVTSHRCSPALVMLLIDAGADPTRRDHDGLTAADHARSNDHHDLANLIERLASLFRPVENRPQPPQPATQPHALSASGG